MPTKDYGIKLIVEAKQSHQNQITHLETEMLNYQAGGGIHVYRVNYIQNKTIYFQLRNLNQNPRKTNRSHKKWRFFGFSCREQLGQVKSHRYSTLYSVTAAH
jgi:hypothetical protein